MVMTRRIFPSHECVMVEEEEEVVVIDLTMDEDY
jgi:hypothetical protein